MLQKKHKLEEIVARFDRLTFWTDPAGTSAWRIAPPTSSGTKASANAAANGPAAS